MPIREIDRVSNAVSQFTDWLRAAISVFTLVLIVASVLLLYIGVVLATIAVMTGVSVFLLGCAYIHFIIIRSRNSGQERTTGVSSFAGYVVRAAVVLRSCFGKVK